MAARRADRLGHRPQREGDKGEGGPAALPVLLGGTQLPTYLPELLQHLLASSHLREVAAPPQTGRPAFSGAARGGGGRAPEHVPSHGEVQQVQPAHRAGQQNPRQGGQHQPQVLVPDQLHLEGRLG